MEKLKQEINRHIHSKNNFWTALVVSLGGTLALLFNLDSTLKAVFLIIGFLVSFYFLGMYNARSRYIDYLIDKSEEKNDTY